MGAWFPRWTSFLDGRFDRVLCVQNGVCAFGVDPALVAHEALRLVQPGGLGLLSTYAPSFWPHRLEWFEAQASAGLQGEIDRDRTRDGTIVCRDGFRAGSLGYSELAGVFRAAGVEPSIVEVDESSLFAVAARAKAV